MYLTMQLLAELVYMFRNFVNIYQQTRAPRGTDHSPEYNEHFCY